MKTSEQTKRAISVGLITTAWAVIVASATLFCGVTAARAQEPDNRIDWRWGRPGVMVVTNAPTALTVTNIATTVATEVAGGVAENLFGPRVSALEGGTNNWNTAYGWGNHAGLYRAIGWVPSWAEVTGKPDLFDWNWNSLTNKPATFPPTAHAHPYTDITDPPWLEEYTETDPIWAGVANTVTAGAALGATAVQSESDPVAMAALAGYQSAAYWPPDATASSWFTFATNANEITITGYNIGGGTDVVIPDYINGLPVTVIGVNAFAGSGTRSIGGAGNVVAVGGSVFMGCTSLASVSLPQVQTVGSFAFELCGALTSLYFNDDAPTIGAGIFAEITANQVTNYVTNPQATGWGEKLGGMPVVRLPLYASAVYQDGELVATTNYVGEQIAAMPVLDLSDHPTFSQIAASNALPYTAWTGTITPADGTATVAIAHGNQPVLVIDAPTVLQLDATGFGTSGVSRVSLSYYTGTNGLTFATNIIKYAETPTVDTNGWNGLLIRRISNGTWKGVGL